MVEAAKTATAPNQEHPYPPPPVMMPYPHQGYSGAPYAGPPGYMPHIFPYPPPPHDACHPEGSQNGTVPQPPPQYMMIPPGVLYAYPPHPQPPFGTPPQNPSASSNNRPKRKQVKMACTNCALACKKCDESRPCERCVKYNLGESCVDGQRKERKRGVKRGPYNKRKKDGEGDWPSGTATPTTATTAAAIHAVAQYTPEGYYQVFYPSGFLPPPPPGAPHPGGPHDGQPPADGSPPHPPVPYFVHPGAYPPFAYQHIYGGPPPPGAPVQLVSTPGGAPIAPPPPQPAPPAQPAPTQAPAAQPPGQPQPEEPQTVNPADTAGKPNSAAVSSDEPNGDTAAGKKRPRGSKGGEGKSSKKSKVIGTAKAKDGDVNGSAAPGTANGVDGEGEGSDSAASSTASSD
ncbi:hypothetical protein BJ165DRAFT_1524830 [Panaeolus papilionaceus]|nr:hypothetical protein BJ165DRAFT_1524830 [Panaeolus papilionaceus]